MKKTIFYGAVLIGTYLALAHATGGGRLLTAGFDGGAKFVKTLQGR